jgi:hypothetical protein
MWLAFAFVTMLQVKNKNERIFGSALHEGGSSLWLRSVLERLGLVSF